MPISLRPVAHSSKERTFTCGRIVSGAALSAALLLAACGGGGGGGDLGRAGLPTDTTVVVGGSIVAGDGTGSAKLGWAPPTETLSGDPLGVGDIVAYRIYYGPTSGQTKVIEIADPYASEFVVNGLTPGVYRFEVTAVASDGEESGGSNSLTKTIQ